MRAGSGSARRTGHALWAGARADATPTNGPRLPAGRLAVGTFSATGLRMDTVPPCFVSMHFSCHSHRTLPAKGAVER